MIVKHVLLNLRCDTFDCESSLQLSGFGEETVTRKLYVLAKEMGWKNFPNEYSPFDPFVRAKHQWKFVCQDCATKRENKIKEALKDFNADNIIKNLD